MATLAVARRPISRQSSTKRADLAERQAVVFAEVRNRLVIGSEPTQQPHHLDIAPSFSFEPPARLHPVQVAVDVKLQEHRGMVRRPTSCRRFNPLEAHLRQIERIDKHIDHANGVTFVNEIIEAFGQQRPLPTISLLNEAPHQFPRRITRRIITAARRFHTARVKTGKAQPE
jgi:hypothetical protein